MILNDYQKTDFYQGLKKISYFMTSENSEHLDSKEIENRIQQTIGVLNLLEKLNLKDNTYKKIMVNTLKTLFEQKRKLLYGYVEDNKNREVIACY
ncbi:MAG: hypothetical protein OEV44_02505 [Spirochaetota bacterium]|nr:hypothetical protein [Spirochaetota bacterium]